MTLARRQTIWLFAALAATVYTAVIFITRAHAGSANAGAVGLGAACDLTITVPVLYYLLLVRPGYSSWMALIASYNDPVGLLLKDTLGSAKTLKAVLGRITPVKSCHVQLDGKQYNRADAERLEDNAGRCKFTPLVVCNRGAH
jgi:hypothetical protein